MSCFPCIDIVGPRSLGKLTYNIPGTPNNQFVMVGYQLDDEPNHYHGKMVGNHQTFISKWLDSEFQVIPNNLNDLPGISG